MRGGLFLVCLMLSGLAAGAQDYRGEAAPVARQAASVDFSRLRFLTFAFGREGPMDAPLRTPPIQGREYFVEADVFGIEGAATIRFDFVDAGGRPLQTLTMWRDSDSATDGEFHGFVTIPRQPFRVAVSGTGTTGAPFRSILDTLFQPPASGPAEQPILPGGISADDSARLQNFVAAYRQELKARASQAAAEHPGGLITLARSVVSRIAYEPLNAASGAPIGMRLQYSIQFPSRQTLVAVPFVFPVYPSADWRGVVEMKALAGTITPAPKMAGVETLQDVIVYRAAATYEPGIPYRFRVDLVPDYVFQGIQTGRFCIYEQKFRNRAVWQALISSRTAIPYSISIQDTETFASVPAFFPQRTFYESFAAGGASDCGPVPNNRF